jgi:acetyltransferase-like isoleucine patch superfamily enzyme
VRRLVQLLPMYRWWRSLTALMQGARVHPSALILGMRSQVRIGSGSKIGPRTRIAPGMTGKIDVGQHVWVASDVEFQTDTRLAIGSGSSIQRRSTVNGTTRLGRDCILAPSVFISSGTHPIRVVPYLAIRTQERLIAGNTEALAELDNPVWVQDDCWLGAHVVVCPGVTIGKGSVVGANAVVTKDVPPYSVVAGCPAQIIGVRLEWRPPNEIDPSREEDGPYLLDAHIIDKGGATVIEVAPGSPMLAALNAPLFSSHIEIEWRANRPSTLNLCGSHFPLTAGAGSLKVKASQADICEGSLRVGASLDTDGCVDILAVRIIPSTIGVD